MADEREGMSAPLELDGAGVMPTPGSASPPPQPSDGTTSHSTKPASGQAAGYPLDGGGSKRDAQTDGCAPSPQPSPENGGGSKRDAQTDGCAPSPQPSPENGGGSKRDAQTD
jgi:hypothetical protein